MSYLAKTARFFTLTVAALTILSSCQKKEMPAELPESGKIEYDILYSGSLRDNGIMGSMLPSKAISTYNAEGFKISVQAGLGFVKLDIVATIDDSFVVLNISGQKMIIPFESLFSEEDLALRDSCMTIEHSNKKEIVAGYESECMIAKTTTSAGITTLEAYYVPFKTEHKTLKDSPLPNVPGVITAVKLISDDANIILMLSDYEEKNVTSDEFARPKDAHYGTRNDVDSLIVINFDNNK